MGDSTAVNRGCSGNEFFSQNGWENDGYATVSGAGYQGRICSRSAASVQFTCKPCTVPYCVAST